MCIISRHPVKQNNKEFEKEMDTDIGKMQTEMKEV